jgi:acetyl esterase/lipase
MTFITSFMRNVADHSSLADVVLIRRLFSLQTIIPVPSDAVVTPITFTVPLRTGQAAARGFLKEWDELETGTRELTGEWVVGVDVWKRLKADRRARLQAERKRYMSSPLAETATATATASVPGTAAYFANRPGSTGRQRTTSGDARNGRYTPSNDSDTESNMTARKSFAGERVIYYIHGGAYYVGNAATHRLITIGISKACNARVFGELPSTYIRREV